MPIVQINLLAITETWLSSSDTASPAALSHGGLSFTHSTRPGDRSGGGVGFLLSPNCTCRVIHPEPSLSSSFEVHTIRIFYPFNPRISVIYRPPGPSSQFLDNFAVWLPHCLSSDLPSIVLGDINIPIDNPFDPTSIKLFALFFIRPHSMDLLSHPLSQSLKLVFSHQCTDFSNFPLL